MRLRIVAATACLVIATTGAAEARIADRDIEYIVSRNEATREQLGSVRYEFAQGAYLYSTPPAGDLVPLLAIPDKRCISQRRGTVLARGDYRAWEVEALLPGGDGYDPLNTRTFAVRNDRYFALSHGVITDGGFASFGDVHLYPHSTQVGGRSVGVGEELRYMTDVLDYAFLSDRLGHTLRREVEGYFHPDCAGSLDLEVLMALDGGVREYRLHLRGARDRKGPGLVTYALDPQVGYLITRKETYDQSGTLVAQRRISSMPLGETGLHFPAEVIEITFGAEDSPDGPLPMPRTETRTVARDVELLRSGDASGAFALRAFGLDEEEMVMLHDGARPTRMSMATAEQMSQEARGSRSTNPRLGETRPAPAPSVGRPTASGGILANLWWFLTGLFGGVGAIR